MIDKDKAIYERELSNCEVIVFKESGHELWFPNYHRFIDTVKEFMDN